MLHVSSNRAIELFSIWFASVEVFEIVFIGSGTQGFHKWGQCPCDLFAHALGGRRNEIVIPFVVVRAIVIISLFFAKFLDGLILASDNVLLANYFAHRDFRFGIVIRFLRSFFIITFVIFLVIIRLLTCVGLFFRGIVISSFVFGLRLISGIIFLISIFILNGILIIFICHSFWI